MRISRKFFWLFWLCPQLVWSQINTDRVLLMGRNALHYEDYVLSIRYFNQVIDAKPFLSEPYFFRGLAKFYLEDFTGAEVDCTKAIEINPFIPRNYELKGLCQINLKDFQGAVSSYDKLLEIEPMNKNAWHNWVLCQIELKDFAEAKRGLGQMARFWAKDPDVYITKAQVALLEKDTTECLVQVDNALKLNAYMEKAWAIQALVSYDRGDYKAAESALDKAIRQNPREAGYYINRALARYNQANLRGAMSDYDAALDYDPKNYLAHFNRGLLRAQVGDDNRAIDDFNFVLELEPDNMIALFNRALMLNNTGDYRGAIQDISAVLKEYPDFLAGYQYRAQIRRKIGDIAGAERDEFVVLKAQMEQGNPKKKKTAATRKQSSRNIDDYNKLVEADTKEVEETYANVYRGKVQDKTVEARPLPLFVLSYYQAADGLNKQNVYNRVLDRWNRARKQQRPLVLTTKEESLDDAHIASHFASIDSCSRSLSADHGTVETLFVRAVDYYLVQDFAAALQDLNRLIERDSSFALAYFVRAQVLYKQSYGLTEGKSKQSISLSMASALGDMDKVIELQPDFACAYYNKGVLLMESGQYTSAIEAYSRALLLDSRFSEAFYNRGLAYIQNGEYEKGVNDLSRAGELGMYTAYNLIKKYSSQVPK